MRIRRRRWRARAGEGGFERCCNRYGCALLVDQWRPLAHGALMCSTVNVISPSYAHRLIYAVAQFGNPTRPFPACPHASTLAPVGRAAENPGRIEWLGFQRNAAAWAGCSTDRPNRRVVTNGAVRSVRRPDVITILPSPADLVDQRLGIERPHSFASCKGAVPLFSSI